MKTFRVLKWLGLATVLAATGRLTAAEDGIVFRVADIEVSRALYEQRFQASFGPQAAPYRFDKSKSDWLESWVRTLAAAVEAREKGYNRDPRVVRSVAIMRRFTLLKGFRLSDAQAVLQHELGRVDRNITTVASFPDYRSALLVRAEPKLNEPVAQKMIERTFQRAWDIGSLQPHWYEDIAGEVLYTYSPPGSGELRTLTVGDFLEGYEKTVMRRPIFSRLSLIAQIESTVLDEYSYGGLVRAGRENEALFQLVCRDGLLKSALLAYADDLAKKTQPVSEDDIAREWRTRAAEFTRSKRVRVLELQFVDLLPAGEAWVRLQRRRGAPLAAAVEGLPVSLTPARRQTAEMDLEVAELPDELREELATRPVGWVSPPRPAKEGYAIRVKVEELESEPETLTRASLGIREDLERARFETVRARLLQTAVQNCMVRFYSPLDADPTVLALALRLNPRSKVGPASGYDSK